MNNMIPQTYELWLQGEVDCFSSSGDSRGMELMDMLVIGWMQYGNRLIPVAIIPSRRTCSGESWIMNGTNAPFGYVLLAEPPAKK